LYLSSIKRLRTDGDQAYVIGIVAPRNPVDDPTNDGGQP
jgi:hypothetical protein